MFRFRSCAQENLYKHLWATKQLKGVINRRLFPALPGYSGYRAGYSGPHCPECPGAVSGLKNQGCPEYSGIYPESPGTLSPNGYFWAEDYKYSLHTPSALSLATLDEQNSNLSQRELPHSPFFILERFPWGIWVRSKQEQGLVLVSLIPTSWALGFGQARGFKFGTLGALCS